MGIMKYDVDHDLNIWPRPLNYIKGIINLLGILMLAGNDTLFVFPRCLVPQLSVWILYHV